tara:strand:+ start:72081 stop:72800 length:720 start_codon:yes stop_codon:yes gene_type:complete
MKKLFLLLCVAAMVSNVNAQDQAFTENIWYFSNGELDGEIFTIPASYDTRLEYVEFSTFKSLEIIHPFCEESMDAGIDQIDNENFTLLSAEVVLVGVCGPGPLQALMEPHYRVYGDYPNSTTPFNPFTYNIEMIDDYLQLTITNGNGDFAVYNSVPLLALPEFDETGFVLYPNPARDRFSINSTHNEVTKVSIYDIQGKLVQTIVDKLTEIDISFLKSGFYLIRLQTEDGAVYKKIVKE